MDSMVCTDTLMTLGHPIFLVSGLVIPADDTPLVYTDIFMMAVVLLCCFLKW